MRDYGIQWKSSIFMPRLASRIQLKITDIRIERLQGISEDDACDEGAGVWAENPDNRPKWSDGSLNKYNNHRQAFQALWQSINGDASWNANPWVWVVEFERIKP
jgi:hypothetical protein